MKNNKFTYKYVKEYIENHDYELISKKYINSNYKLIIKDNIGYYYFIYLYSLQNHMPNKFDKSNPYTIQNIKLWCKLNNKSFELLSDTYEGNSKKLKWKCLKEDCREIFEKSWNSIYANQNCGYCAGKQVGLSNCLATKNPQLASEWHPTLNGDLTPYDVTYSSHKEVWWKCEKGHEWFINVNNRTVNGCPYCSGLYPSEENNLLVNNPKLCDDWNYDKNNKKPEEYTHNANKYVNWICKECKHEWSAKISDRNQGNGCPECRKSKGEKEIDNVLIDNNWIKINQQEFNKLINEDRYNKNYFIPQIKYNGLIGVSGKLLSYDYYIPKLNLLIEYDGEFHFRLIKLYKNEPKKDAEERYKKQCVHDIRKNKYAMDNDIDLLRIPYWEFDNLEEILNDYVFKIINI